MRKPSRVIFLVAVVFFVYLAPAQAFWLWSPKTKKLVNPKWAAKHSPEAQLDYAKGIFEIENYKVAYQEFQSLLRHFPEAREAADAQFYLGACLEKMGNPNAAFRAYQKVIDKYPFNTLSEKILERQLAIAEELTDTKRKVLGMKFSQVMEAVDCYRKIIENDPYGKFAPVSQYRIGLIYKSLESYDEAKQEFEKVITTYPESEWVQAAKYQAAQTADLASLRPNYDQELTKEAQDRFEEFVAAHPNAEFTKEAEEQIQELTDRQAEKDFNVAVFYEKQESYTSARLYYEDVIRQFPDSLWAQKARERLDQLPED